ncbi:MAG: hypothetical protein ACXACC_10365 [Promethearchaeota archaeon]|jgi:magnesium-transporting ATPase (P-type)
MNKEEVKRKHPYHPQEPYYPPSQPFFSSRNLPKIIGIGVIVCIIMLFVGTLLTAGAYYIDVEDADDIDFQRSILATTVLVGGIGLFVLGLITTAAFIQIHDLSERQRIVLGMILVGTIFAFAILIR